MEHWMKYAQRKVIEAQHKKSLLSYCREKTMDSAADALIEWTVWNDKRKDLNKMAGDHWNTFQTESYLKTWTQAYSGALRAIEVNEWVARVYVEREMAWVLHVLRYRARPQDIPNGRPVVPSLSNVPQRLAVTDPVELEQGISLRAALENVWGGKSKKTRAAAQGVTSALLPNVNKGFSMWRLLVQYSIRERMANELSQLKRLSDPKHTDDEALRQSKLEVMMLKEQIKSMEASTEADRNRFAAERYKFEERIRRLEKSAGDGSV